MFVATRVFAKSEDSASKEYVDAKCEKLELKIEKKADKDAFDRIDAKLDALYKLLIEQRGQSQQK